MPQGRLQDATGIGCHGAGCRMPRGRLQDATGIGCHGAGCRMPRGRLPPRANRAPTLVRVSMGGRGGELWRSQGTPRGVHSLSKLPPPSSSSARAIASTEAACAGPSLAPATPPGSRAWASRASSTASSSDADGAPSAGLARVQQQLDAAPNMARRVSTR